MASLNPLSVLTKMVPFRRKSKGFVRAHQRYECCIIGEIRFIDRGYSLDGAIRELSIGGALFRSPSNYILHRERERVVVQFDKYDRSGMIMNTRPEGYGIRFDEAIDGEILDRISGEFGLQPIDVTH